MSFFGFLKPKKNNSIRVAVNGGVAINGKKSSSTIYDEVIDVGNVNFEYKECDLLDDYQIKHFSFHSLDDAVGKKKQYEDKIKRERTNGFAIKGGSNLYKLTTEDKLSIKDFDLLIQPILKEVKAKPLEDSIKDIANLYILFNKNKRNEISIGYAKWYLEYATILFDIENQFKNK